MHQFQVWLSLLTGLPTILCWWRAYQGQACLRSAYTLAGLTNSSLRPARFSDESLTSGMVLISTFCPLSKCTNTKLPYPLLAEVKGLLELAAC
jgi:hypothetical protein